MVIKNIGVAAGSIAFKVAQVAIDIVKSSLVQKAWNGVRNLFSLDFIATKLKPSDIREKCLDLKYEFLSSTQKASSQISEERRAAFSERAASMVQDVMDDCLRSVEPRAARGLKVKANDFEAAAKRARSVVERHLQVELSLERDKSEIPSVKKILATDPNNPDGPKIAKFVVIRAAPPIENLVLRGGGAKGVGNAPALRALENLGKLSDLKKVVGTSAGALTAVSIASGMSAKDFQKLANETDMIALLSSPKDFSKKYPEVQLGASDRGLDSMRNMGFEAGNALEILDQASAKSVSNYLNGHWEEIQNKPQWGNLAPVDKQRLEALKVQDFNGVRTKQMITFGDLNLLHQLDPGKFKDLVLTGYNSSAQETIYFSAASHADMPVALAGRISMSIPVFFKPVEILIDGRKEHLVDGGVGSNMPSEVITQGLSGDALAEANMRTLLMTYDENGEAYSVMHSSPYERAKLSGGLVRVTNQKQDNQKIYDAGLNVLPVFHGNLGTLSFTASAKEVEKAQTLSMLNTLEYIENVMGGARHDIVNNEEEAARLFSAPDQEIFLQKYQASMDPLDVAMCDAILRLRELPQAAMAVS